MNILCIVDQNYQRLAIAVEKSSKFKAIQWILNPPYMGYNTKNGAAFQELLEESPILGKRRRKLLLEIEKKEGKKLKSFLILLK